MREPFQVWENVYQVGGSEVSGSGDCCVYLVKADGGLVLVDSGVGRNFKTLIENIENLGFSPENLKTVIATHRHIDHVGSIARLKAKLGVEVVAHKLDAEGIETGRQTCAELYGVSYDPCEVDREMEGERKTLELGKYDFNLLHIPGHTPGSIACYLDVRGKRVLFGQDIHGPYSFPDSDPSKAKTSLSKLLDLEAEILCEGHSGIYRPREEVERYIQSYLDIL